MQHDGNESDQVRRQIVELLCTGQYNPRTRGIGPRDSATRSPMATRP